MYPVFSSQWFTLSGEQEAVRVGRGGGRSERASERARERERERTQHSELYNSRIEISGIYLFLQYVFANLHANTYTTTVRTLTTIITMMKMTMIIYW